MIIVCSLSDHKQVCDSVEANHLISVIDPGYEPRVIPHHFFTVSMYRRYHDKVSLCDFFNRGVRLYWENPVTFLYFIIHGHKLYLEQGGMPHFLKGLISHGKHFMGRLQVAQTGITFRN